MLRADREIMVKVVSQNGDALQYASEALKKEHDVVMAAVLNKWQALLLANTVMRGDRDIVLKAVSQNGDALGFATEDLGLTSPSVTFVLSF